MRTKSRCFFSGALVFALFFSALILSNPRSARACPVSPPTTLLSLYLKSDLIVVADIDRATDGEITTNEEEYLYLNVIRKLRVDTVLKGKTESEIEFTQSEYRSKNQKDEDSQESYFSSGYKVTSKLTVGERYMFFLTFDTEDKQFRLTDRESGAKKLNDDELSIHKKRVRELRSIVGKKDENFSALTRWLIRLVEEPATRWDGVSDLNDSFFALDQEERSEEEAADESKEEEREAFVIDKDFSGYNPEIARNISDAQKAHLSDVLFRTLQQDSMQAYPDQNIPYGFIGLVSRWDQMRLTTYAFSFFQASDKTDVEKTYAMMSFISDVIGDAKLYESTENFRMVDEEETEETTESSTPKESSDADRAAEVGNENSEKIDKDRTEQNSESGDEVEAKTDKPTPTELRAKLIQDFVSRYEYLLARGFQVDEEEAETEDVAEVSDDK